MFTIPIYKSYQCGALFLVRQAKNYCYNYNFGTIKIRKLKANLLLCKYRKAFPNVITFMLIINLIMWHECLRIVSAAPQSCVLCDKNDIAARDPQHNTNYEEFLFEHQVTRQDAINALRSLNQSFYDEPSTESSCKAIICSNSIKKYCLGPQFINDHCWCELGHNNEGLPFVPHICYVGEKAHKAFGGSCFLYEEVKECCCASALAKQWRHISSSKRSLPNLLTSIIMLITSLLVI